jgi:hypothetical protein
MKTKTFAIACGMTALVLCGCRVDTKTESVPEAEGSGKKAINIRVEPMTRDEMKAAASDAIDKTADAATQLRSAATTAVENLQTVGKTVTTLSDTMININRQPNDAVTTAP